jgi:hypothetical protein
LFRANTNTDVKQFKIVNAENNEELARAKAKGFRFVWV